MDVSMNTMASSDPGFTNNEASSLIPGAIVLHGMICAWSSKYPPEIGLRASGGINFEPAGRTRGSRDWPSVGQLQVCRRMDPRAKSVGPVRGSAAKNSRIILLLLLYVHCSRAHPHFPSQFRRRLLQDFVYVDRKHTKNLVGRQFTFISGRQVNF